jgi:hypothetical protein
MVNYPQFAPFGPLVWVHDLAVTLDSMPFHQFFDEYLQNASSFKSADTFNLENLMAESNEFVQCFACG